MAASSPIEIDPQLMRDLHTLHRTRSDLTAQLDRGPKQLAAGEAILAKADAAVEQARADVRTATLASDQKQHQLLEREERIKNLESKLNVAASNREFALLKEQIAADLKANEVLSDEILEALEELDRIGEQAQAAAEHRETLAGELRQRAEETRQRLGVVETDLKRVEADLAELETRIPAAMAPEYRRLVDHRGDEALAAIDSDSCGGCSQTLTTQTVDQVRRSLLIRCPNCDAYLYFSEDRRVR